MNQENNNNISNVFLEMSKTIDYLGINQTIDILKISRQKFNVISIEKKDLCNSIITIVCKVFDITISDFYSRTRKNNRRFAIGITAMIFTDNLSLDISDVSFLLKKPVNLVSSYRKEVKELNPNHKSDVKIIEKINEINKELINIK